MHANLVRLWACQGTCIWILSPLYSTRLVINSDYVGHSDEPLAKKKKNYSWPVRRWMQVQGKGKDLDDSPRLISTVNWWDLLLSTTVLFFFYVWSILYLLTYYVFGSLIQSTSVQWLVTLLKHGSNEKLCVCCNFYIVAVGWYLSTGLW